MKFNDLTGQKFNSWTALSLHSKGRSGHTYWYCRCECGNERAVNYSHLVYEKSKSCGCKNRRQGSRHPQWKGAGEISGNFWNNIARAQFDRGRRSIEVKMTVEEAWDLFLRQDRKCALSGIEIFFSNSESHSGTASLDRIDSSGPYSVENTQWVHKDINKMKNSFNQDYFIEMCNMVSIKSMVQ